jgi:hypothetical protein
VTPPVARARFAPAAVGTPGLIRVACITPVARIESLVSFAVPGAASPPTFRA